MITVTWSDGKIEERLDRIDERFDRVDERIVETAKETDRRLKEVDRRITATAKETYRHLDGIDRRIIETSGETNRRLGEMKELKQEMRALQTTFQRGNFALVASVFGVLVATILNGG